MKNQQWTLPITDEQSTLNITPRFSLFQCLLLRFSIEFEMYILIYLLQPHTRIWNKVEFRTEDVAILTVHKWMATWNKTDLRRGGRRKRSIWNIISILDLVLILKIITFYFLYNNRVSKEENGKIIPRHQR